MSYKRTAEKNKRIVKQLKEKTAIETVDIEGKRHVKCLNADKKDVRRSFLGNRIFYNCPKCGKSLKYNKKMHQGLCMSCGQRLNWGDYDDMAVVWILARDSEEAGYWAAQYEAINGSSYGIDVEKWRVTRKEYPLLLYFPFPYGKEYGRFMRKAAKEATIVKEINGGYWINEWN